MKQTITIMGNVPMLNGDDGLIRAHHRKLKKQKTNYYYEILSQNPRKFKGKVTVSLTRFSSRAPDPDNVAASGKLILDALVDAKVLTDDSMKVITEYNVNWEKSSNKKQRTEIEIEAVG